MLQEELQEEYVSWPMSYGCIQITKTQLSTLAMCSLLVSIWIVHGWFKEKLDKHPEQDPPQPTEPDPKEESQV